MLDCTNIPASYWTVPGIYECQEELSRSRYAIPQKLAPNETFRALVFSINTTFGGPAVKFSNVSVTDAQTGREFAVDEVSEGCAGSKFQTKDRDTSMLDRPLIIRWRIAPNGCAAKGQ